MPFVFRCRHCQKPVSAQEDQIGLLMACPHCAGQFSVPESDGMEAPRHESSQVSTQAAASALRAAMNASLRATPSISSLRFSFSCLRCGSILEAKGDMCGQKGRCPTCGAVFTVPQIDPQTGVAMSAAQVAEDGQLPTPMHAYATAGDRAPKVIRKADGSQSIQCPRCLRQMPIDANICSACGIPFTMEGASTIVQSSSELNPLAGWALTLGILSILTFCLPIAGLAAIGLGWVSLRKARAYGSGGGRGMALAGIILGAISLIGFGLFCYKKYF